MIVNIRSGMEVLICNQCRCPAVLICADPVGGPGKRRASSTLDDRIQAHLALVEEGWAATAQVSYLFCPECVRKHRENTAHGRRR